MMIRYNGWLLILLSTVLVDAFVIRQANTDDICGRISGVLCINDTLALIVATGIGSIEPIAKTIENTIISGSEIDGKYHQLVEKKILLIQSHLPSSYYHSKFFDEPNIDQKFLGHLLKEAHYALSYFYNVINEFFKLEHDFQFDTNDQLKKIQNLLVNEMICPYRNILTVYNLRWQSINEVPHLQLSRHHELAQSTVENMYLLVLTKLLREWMHRINSVVIILDKKFH